MSPAGTLVGPSVGSHPFATSRRSPLPWLLGLLLLVCPDLALAQAPIYVGQWGVFGTEAGQFKYPRGVAVGTTGDVYVTDTENSRIQHFTAAGAFVKKWGEFGTEALQFRVPFGIGVDSDGSVYVADVQNRLLKKFNDYAGLTWAYGGEYASTFRTMAGVAVAASGIIFVSVEGDSRVYRVASTGSSLGPSPFGFGNVDNPVGVAVTGSGDFFVAEQHRHRITRLSATGTVVRRWGTFGTANGQFQQPIGIAIDASGLVYVLECAGNRVQVFTQEGVYVTQWGSFGTGPGQFQAPMGIAIAPGGDVYVADTENCRIQRFSQAATATARSSWTRVKQLYR